MDRFFANSFWVLYLSLASVSTSQILNQRADYASINRNMSIKSNSLNIYYNTSVLQELKPGVCLVAGDKDRVILSCESTNSGIEPLNWIYHGLKEMQVSFRYARNHVLLKDFKLGPPVVRMECISRTDTAISTDLIVYAGDGKPPFLFHHGKTIPATVIDATTIQMPCIEILEQFQPILLKDDKLLHTDETAVKYSPELGYLIQWNNLSEPFGTYECRVINATTNDSVRMVFTNDIVVRSEIEVTHSLGMTSFFEGDPQKRVFRCTIPVSRFENRFEWYFLLMNGSYMPINATKSRLRRPSNPLLFTDSVKFNFSRKDISHVVCVAYTKDNMTKYNNSYAVEVKVPLEPRIIKNHSLNQPITYVRGMNLTCQSVGDPINIMWLKNGDPVYNLNAEYSYISTIRTTTLFLNPPVDDFDSNYTCKVENFMAQDNFTFRVQLQQPNQETDISLVAQGVCLAVQFICGSGHCPITLFNDNSALNRLEADIQNLLRETLQRQNSTTNNTTNIIRDCISQSNRRNLSSSITALADPGVHSNTQNLTYITNQT